MDFWQVGPNITQDWKKTEKVLSEAATSGVNRQVKLETSIDPEKIKVQLEAIRKSQITYTQKLANAGQDTLQIGDLIFGMPNTKDETLTPPIAINATKQALNFKWKTLRTDSSVKVASGKSNARVGLSLYFVGRDAINSGLRRLAATFNSLPFVYVENSFIRANLAPDNWGNMAFSLVGLNVRTEQGLPNVLVADLDLMWFNYLPYANNFWFRQKWDSVLELKNNNTNAYNGVMAKAEGVKYKSPEESELTNPTKQDPTIAFSSPAIQPLESKPLMDHVSSREGPLMDELSNAIAFNYKEYRSVSGFDLSQAVTPGRINPNYLRAVDKSHIVPAFGSRPDFRLNPEAAKLLEELAADYYSETGKNDPKTGETGKSRKLRMSACFRTREMQLAEYAANPQNAEPPGSSRHEVGLAIDVPITGHKYRRNYEIFLSLAAKKGLSQAGNGRLVRWNEDGTSPYNLRNRPPRETWHFNFTDLWAKYKKELGQTKPEEVIKRLVLKIYYGNVTSEATGETLKEEEQEKRNKEYIGVVGTKIKELIKQGYELDVPEGAAARVRSSSSSRLVFFKRKTFKILEHDPELVPQGISIAKHNIVPQLPIASHEYATQQYLGSTDMDAVVTFSALSEERLQHLQIMISLLQRNSRADREIRDSAVVDIKNSLFNFMGFERALIESVDVRSIPGSPGLYDVTLQLTQYKTPDPQLAQEKYLPGSAWLKIAEHVYGSLISLDQSKIQVYLRALAAERPKLEEESALLRAGSRDVDRMVRAGYIKDPEQIHREVKVEKASFSFFTPEIQRRLLNLWNGDEHKILAAADGRDETIAGVLMQYAVILGKAIDSRLSFNLSYQLGMESKQAWIDYGQHTASTPGQTEEDLFFELRKKLRALGNQIVHKKYYEDVLFARIAKDIEKFIAEVTPGTECYPDLHLPPHKVTQKSEDTPPDYWFYNEPIDGGLLFEHNDLEALEEARQVMGTAYEYVDKIMSPKEWLKRQISPNRPEIQEKSSTPLVGGIASKGAAAAALHIDEAGIGKAGEQSYDKSIAKPILSPDAIKKEDNLRHPRNPINYANLPDKISFGKRTKSKNEIDSDPSIVKESVTGKDSRKLNEIFEQAFAHFNNNIHSLARAYPTFKIYFMEEDSADYTTANMRNFDDFYSYSAVKDIRIVRSRKIPADLCVISITNIHGELDTLAYRSGDDPFSSEHIVEKFDPANVDTSVENPFSKLVVVEGSKIQVRLGYSNHPDDLETLFNGQVVEVGVSPICPDIIQLVCQSYAVELTAEKKDGGTYWDTQELLSMMMLSDEMQHFGRWSSRGVYDPREIRTKTDASIQPGFLGSTAMWKKVREGKLNIWNFENDPRDDNIFAPVIWEYSETMQKLTDMAQTIGFKSALEVLDVIDDERKYFPVDATVWDIFKEMELRHPGFISSPVPYGNRYTMFFGAPNDLYWSRPMTIAEEKGWKPIVDMDAALTYAMSDYNLEGESYKYRDIWHYAVATGQTKPMRLLTARFGPTMAKLYKKRVERLVKKRMERFRPFRTYHFLSSRHNIIANNIYASSHGTYNAIDLIYMKDNVRLTKAELRQATTMGPESLEESKFFLEQVGDKKVGHIEMKADDNIEDKDTRIFPAFYPGCFGRFYATRYAVSLLMRSLKDIYKGEITITGNPSVKPYDVCVEGNTLIQTENGPRKIKNLFVGDKVLTHKGKFEKVAQKFERIPKEKVYQLKCRTDPESLTITGNHPVLSLKREEVFHIERGNPVRDIYGDRVFAPEFRRADQLNPKDYLAFPLIKSKNSLNASLARLVGYYLAEGNVIYEMRKSSRRGRKLNCVARENKGKLRRVNVAIKWSFDLSKERYMEKEIEQLLVSAGINKKPRTYENKKRNELIIILYDRDFTDFIIRVAGYSDYGENNENKYLRARYDEETSKNILGAYFNGDGCRASKIRKGYLTSSSTSLNLGRSVRHALIDAKIPVCSSLCKNGGEWASVNNPYIWQNVISTYYANSLTQYTKFENSPNQQKKTNTLSFINGDYLYMPIETIAELPGYSDKVYNIGVEKDNSYVANGKTVHNCWIADDYRDMYGMVEVEQVTHIFSQETGFITEIKPDLILSHNATTTQCTLEAIWEAGSKFFQSLWQKSPGAAGLGSTAFLGGAVLAGSALVGKIGMILAILGGYRLMTWSQARQPIFYTPLIQSGKPLIAGLHGYKYDDLWVSIKGKFAKFKGDAGQGWDVLTKSSMIANYFREWLSN